VDFFALAAPSHRGSSVFGRSRQLQLSRRRSFGLILEAF
jgi:hypothetical protein